MELLTQLGIDWKVLISQIVNFLILFFILTKLIYKPVLTMLDKRTKLIQEGIDNAEKSKKELAEIEALREKRLSKAQKEVGVLLDKARADADAVKKDILETAQKQSEELVERTKRQLEEEKTKMIEDVKAEVGNFVVKLTGKLLEREFTEADQSRLADAVAKEMKSAH